MFTYNYAESGRGAGALTPLQIIGLPNATDFRTVGLAYDAATSALFVASHAQAGPRIEVFRLDLDAMTATHARTLTHPLLRSPNAMALLGNHEVYVSNDHYFSTRTWPVLANAEMYLTLPIASVVHLVLDPADYSIRSARVVARVPFANGIARLNDTTLAVASSSAGTVRFYAVAADRSLTFTKQIALPFLPDNLARKDTSTLLIAGHPHLPSLALFAESRHVCNDPAVLAAASDKQKDFCVNVPGLSWVAEWSEEHGLRSLFVESVYGTSTTALWDGEAGFGLITGLYEKGLFTWRA